MDNVLVSISILDQVKVGDINSSSLMEVCFLSSNSFAKTTEAFPLIPAKFPSTRTRPFSHLHFKKASTPLSLKCCLGDSTSSPKDEERASVVDGDWRAFRARLVAGEGVLRSEIEEPYSNAGDQGTEDAPPIITIGDKWAHKIHEPEKGCLLVATEKLDGVHIFERTVILLLSVGALGPTGIILNRPSLMSIKEMRSLALDVAGTFSNRPLFFGGPLEEGVFLVEGEDGVGKSGVLDEVMKGLYYGTKESVGCAAEMVKRNVVGVDSFRFFDGYCAWEREQLRDEIRAGYWTIAACSPSVIGPPSIGSVGLWKAIVGLIGRRKVW